MTWLKNMKIAQKLIVGFMIVAVIAAIVGVIGIINITTIKNADTNMYKNEALGLQYSGAAAVNFQQLRYNVLKMTTLTDPKSIDDTKKLIDQYQTATKENLTKFEKEIKVDNSDIKTAIDNINAAYGQYEPSITKFLELVAANKLTEGNDLVVNTMAPIGATLRDDFLKMMQLVSDEAAASSKANASSAASATIIMIIVVVVAVVIAIILGVYISRIISYPMVKLTSVGRLLSKGDLNIDSVLSAKDYEIQKQKDECGALATVFTELIATTTKQVNALQRLADGDLTVDFAAASEKDKLGMSIITLTESLNGLIGSILTASEQVTSGASMVSHSSMALSQGATEQASSVQQLTASLEQIATQTHTNARSATEANELAREARENAAAGNGQMKEMLSAMEEISASSANINKIIKVIDDIAFQTNILALNAAVEAARAGQHGKGFAVVAEEVRTLAARSANAAKETTDLIENSIKKVEAGTKIANDTAGALHQIVDQVDKAAGLVSSIAKESSEQALGVEQINQGIIQVSQVVQTNAATAEESAAASEELSAQAEQLKETVSVFKVKKSSAAFSGGAGAPSGRPVRQLAGKVPESAAVRKTKLILEDGDMGKY
jgi:methyl-accepting chemotaxis protein